MCSLNKCHNQEQDIEEITTKEEEHLDENERKK